MANCFKYSDLLQVARYSFCPIFLTKSDNVLSFQSWGNGDPSKRQPKQDEKQFEFEIPFQNPFEQNAHLSNLCTCTLL